MVDLAGADGFVDFYRRYAKTWIHGVATAALTAFGTLTFVHELFAVVAVAAYVAPPLFLYFTRSSTASNSDSDTESTSNANANEDPDSTADPAPNTDRDSAPPTRRDHDRTPPAASTDGDDSSWTVVEALTDETLHDVVAGSPSYAVGSGGVVLVDEGDADGWRVALSDGPGADANTLRGVDRAATDGGVWFAGDGGAVGRLDPATGRHVDHSAPDDDTTSLVDVAAADTGDGETVLLADGSGRVRRGRWRDGTVAWDEPVTPGGGSSLTGVVLDGRIGYVCDSNDGVFRTTDGGERFDRLDPVGASGTLTDVATTAEHCLVAVDDGVVHRHAGETWTPVRLDDDPVWALATHDEEGLAGGTAGRVYERVSTADDWRRVVTPASVPVFGVSVDDSTAVAVGADGVVAERNSTTC
ncbi:WD40/YVTN/BNR-like repeat-containing protein [Salinigranum sp. GCM10025319]|uniref:WD40/YVTN/BNR-like repeat-containing protein n=1 Tax=Salinigranum sp. GCM10025319 TaxID=3252687 RepID=UPI00360F0178